MSEYLSGAEVLGDAALRLPVLGDNAGVLIVEGRDDVRLLSPLCRSLDHIIPAGAKWKVLDAAKRVSGDLKPRVLFLVDCDYDVPAGTLSGSLDLILTTHTDVETDLFGLNVVRDVVLQLVPGAASSDSELAATAATVTRRVVALAEPHGRLRYLSRVEGLGLKFDPTRLRKYRNSATLSPDIDKLVRVVLQNSGKDEAFSTIKEALTDTPSGLGVCHGHDLLEALRVVLHQDYGVAYRRLESLDELVRLCAVPELGGWDPVVRIRRWEQTTGRQVLRS